MSSLLASDEIPKIFVTAHSLSSPKMAIFSDFWGFWWRHQNLGMAKLKTLPWPDANHVTGGMCQVLEESDETDHWKQAQNLHVTKCLNLRDGSPSFKPA